MDDSGARDLSGRVALITGADRAAGIGAAICRSLASHGADVVFTTRSGGSEAAEALALQRHIEALGVRVARVEVDLARPDVAPWLFDRAEQLIGPVDILVNNAAHSAQDDYLSLDAATLDRHFAVNARTAALLSVELTRRRAPGPGGRIVMLTSGQGRGPMPGELAYAASKGALEAFGVSLAAEVAALGITVNAVDPGPTDSGWMTERVYETLLPRFPLGRAGTPEDAARLVAFLAGDEAAWITGQVIRSDGGFRRA